MNEKNTQRLNGADHGSLCRLSGTTAGPYVSLSRARDVAKKLGVGVWVIQHASGKRRPYLLAVKMGPGRSPLRFDPADVEKIIDDCRRIEGQRAGFAGR